MNRRQVEDKAKMTVTINGHLNENSRRRPLEAAATDVSISCLNGVNNLRPKCEQTFRLILSNISSDAAMFYEKQLWNDIMQYRHLKDTFLTQYLIGYYVSLMESIVMNGHKEPYLLASEVLPPTKFLLYNIMIRIGDLNRYLNKSSVAESYYMSARKLDVFRGHAYNQLAINTPVSQHFKCIYYYCRAAKSCTEPIPIAETNLKLAVNRFDSGILKSIIRCSKNDSESQLESEEQLIVTYPQKGIDWFYLSVISVFFDNYEVVLKPLIEFLITNCELTSNKHLDNNINNDLDFALMAFDVALDWISSKVNQRIFFDVYAKELKEVKIALKNCSEVIREYEAEDQNQNESHSKALFHDYILRGFGPLMKVHEKLDFDATNEAQDIQSYRLVSRVIDKLDKLFGKSMKPKRMRNVALGSILENESN